jgi:hypothetical protein
MIDARGRPFWLTESKRLADEKLKLLREAVRLRTDPQSFNQMELFQ